MEISAELEASASVLPSKITASPNLKSGFADPVPSGTPFTVTVYKPLPVARSLVLVGEYKASPISAVKPDATIIGSGSKQKCWAL
jgi:hypothetical protein